MVSFLAKYCHLLTISKVTVKMRKCQIEIRKRCCCGKMEEEEGYCVSVSENWMPNLKNLRLEQSDCEIAVAYRGYWFLDCYISRGSEVEGIRFDQLWKAIPAFQRICEKYLDFAERKWPLKSPLALLQCSVSLLCWHVHCSFQFCGRKWPLSSQWCGLIWMNSM